MAAETAKKSNSGSKKRKSKDNESAGSLADIENLEDLDIEDFDCENLDVDDLLKEDDKSEGEVSC